MVLDISEQQDQSMCIVSFLPSVDDYWVLGNSIYHGYYVTHMPNSSKMAFTPFEGSTKQPLNMGDRPTRELKKYYDGWMLLAKFLSSAAIGVAVWAIAEYGFAA